MRWHIEEKPYNLQPAGVQDGAVSNQLHTNVSEMLEPSEKWSDMKLSDLKLQSKNFSNH